MRYQAYQAHSDSVGPLRLWAGTITGLFGRPFPGLTDSMWARTLAAVGEISAFGGLSHRRPDFGIAQVAIGNRLVGVTEEVVQRTAFCTLLRFKKDIDTPMPRVLLVAPMSGHFASLLRETVRTMLPEHDVYITDWHNARDVPLYQGQFDFDDFITHLIQFLQALGPGAHMLAVCQPAVAALAAAAIMYEDDNPAAPRSLILMAGPVDARVNPTKVNEFATGRPIEWFDHHLIDSVPPQFPGALRRVYPGFVQLLSFMSMNLERHLKSFHDLYNDRLKGNDEKARTVRRFYEEYFAVMDLPARFFLETVRLVFQRFALARGVLRWRGRPVDAGAIRRMTLLTVEGERDDICAVGQTLAAHELCPHVRPYRKQHYVQTGVGHYGVFSGRHWNNQVYPIVRDVIHSSD